MSGSKLLDDSSSRGDPDGMSCAGTPAADQPLGLTVHSMPSPDETLGSVVRAPGAGRWKMLAVLLVCAAPVLASYITYYLIKPEGRRNFGELIDPQRPLPNLPGVSLNSDKVNLQSLKGQWLLVSVAGGHCDDACSRHLYLQRQIRESLGKEKDRLDWVWLVPDSAAVPEQLRPALRGAITLRVAPEGLSAWLQPANGQQLADHLYLVDPMGNWMLRFPTNLDMAGAAKAKRDVERVLRASNSWDKAGRETVN